MIIKLSVLDEDATRSETEPRSQLFTASASRHVVKIQIKVVNPLQEMTYIAPNGAYSF